MALTPTERLFVLLLIIASDMSGVSEIARMNEPLGAHLPMLDRGFYMQAVARPAHRSRDGTRRSAAPLGNSPVHCSLCPYPGTIGGSVPGEDGQHT